MKARISNYGDGLQAALDDGRRFNSSDPLELADALFSLGVRSGDVAFPDWRQMDEAPHSGVKIAILARLKQLGNAEDC